MNIPIRIVAGTCLLLIAACGSSPAGDARMPIEGNAQAKNGLDESKIAQSIEAAARLRRLRSLIVLRDGETLVERRFNDGPPLGRPVNVKSASKSIISALVGIAIDRGVLTGTDQKVLSVLARDAPADPDPQAGEADRRRSPVDARRA